MTPPSAIHRLAGLYGVEREYLDVRGRRQQASPETLLRVLQVLGAPVSRPEDVPAAIRARRSALGQTLIEPVAVAWDGKATIALRLPASTAGRFRAELELETGGDLHESGRLVELPVARQEQIEGRRFLVRRLRLAGVPPGYHRLTLAAAGRTAQSLLISAPRIAHGGSAGEATRNWGVFLPAYALHRRTSWGGGDFSDLAALIDWAAEQGASLVAALPMLASNDVAADPSPYSPTSRFFWNEFYVDVTRLPELARSPDARRILQSPATRRLLATLRRQRLVDYERQMGLKRRVMERLAGRLFADRGERRDALEGYCRVHPDALRYAQFRAALERQGRPWRQWPHRLRNGVLRPGDYDESAFQYHLYAQWQADEQLGAAVAHAQAKNLLWYLDYPLGVDGQGYDVWRQPELFAQGVCGGAPPDAFFTKGQNWGFPPLDPLQCRAQGHRYFVAALRRHLGLARLLRFDHVMGLYRLYWVPDGMEASQGTYVRYPMEELLAILSLESRRHQATIVGENLGTVPPEVDAALARHGIRAMHVVQYEIRADRRRPLRPIPASSVASLNTHDMPTFTAFLNALDVGDRVDLRLLEPDEEGAERAKRAAQHRALIAFLQRRGLLAAGIEDDPAVTEACLAYLARSPAATVLVNLEDLWGETLQQNTPGTTGAVRPNWRRRTKLRWEEIRRLPAVLRALARVGAERSHGGAGP